MVNPWSAGWFLVLLTAATCQMTSIQHNVTDITINGSVSVSIKTEGQVTALLLLLSPQGHQFKVSTNCNATSNDEQGTRDQSDMDNITNTLSTVNIIDAISTTPPTAILIPVAAPRSRAAKVTRDDIIAVREASTEGTSTEGSLFSPVTNAKNCLAIQEDGEEESGVYVIQPYDCCPDASVSVYCDQETDGGGWTVIQRRGLYPDHQENFFRNWQSYVDGFGDLLREFWLGLDSIHALTNQSDFEIRFDLKDFDGQSRWAKYDSFHVGSASSDYRMEVSGYSGNAKDSFTRHNGMPFATKDHESSNKCASTYKGAWWYSICHDSNLNGQYLQGQHSTYADGVNWRSWKGYYYSLKFTEMKIRPRNELRK